MRLGLQVAQGTAAVGLVFGREGFCVVVFGGCSGWRGGWGWSGFVFLVVAGGSSGFLVAGGLGVIWFSLVGCCWWELGVHWSGWCAGVGMFEGQCFGERK